MIKMPSKRLALGLLLPLCASSELLAQSLDAGSILRDQPKIMPSAPSRSVDLPAQPQQTTAEESQGVAIVVTGFRISGNSLVSTEALQAQLADNLGQELTLADLKRLTTQLSSFYLKKGYIARVLLPPQNVNDGVISFQVIEGTLGEVKLDLEGERLDSKRTAGFINLRQTRGQALSLPELGASLKILNEQPGINARLAMKPGSHEGSVDIVLKAVETELATYKLNLDNQGGRGTGEWQTNGSVTLHNPTGVFDQAQLMLNVSEGVDFISMDYTRALGSHGWRVGLKGNYLDYEVTQTSLKSLDAHGSATVLGLTAFYPLSRSIADSLSFSADLSQKHLEDYANGAQTGDRTVDVANLTLSGWQRNLLSDASQLSYELKVVAGHSDLSANAASLAADQLSRKTDGSFTKLAWSLGNQMLLPDNWTLNVALKGQWADGNLDSSERLSVAGPSAVRGYVSGQASGDEGWLAQVNFLRPLSNSLQLNLFVDHGQVRAHKDTWAGWNASNPNLKNQYSLTGVGASLDWVLAPATLLSFVLAGELNDDPNNSGIDTDVDGRDRSVRAWVKFETNF